MNKLEVLRATVDGIDAEIERTQKDKRDAKEALRRRIEAWDAHLRFLRRERTDAVAAIKEASMQARGIK